MYIRFTRLASYVYNHFITTTRKATTNMSSISQSLMNIQVHYDDSSCLLWGVLALARLDKKLLSEQDAYYLFDTQGESQALELRRMFDGMVEAFCDERLERTWSNFNREAASAILGHVLNASTDFFTSTYEGIQAFDYELVYLLSTVEAFVMHVIDGNESANSEAYTAMGMLNALSIKMAALCGDAVTEGMFNIFNRLSAEEAPLEYVD